MQTRSLPEPLKHPHKDRRGLPKSSPGNSQEASGPGTRQNEYQPLDRPVHSIRLNQVSGKGGLSFDIRTL